MLLAAAPSRRRLLRCAAAINKRAASRENDARAGQGRAGQVVRRGLLCAHNTLALASWPKCWQRPPRCMSSGVTELKRKFVDATSATTFGCGIVFNLSKLKSATNRTTKTFATDKSQITEWPHHPPS